MMWMMVRVSQYIKLSKSMGMRACIHMFFFEHNCVHVPRIGDSTGETRGGIDPPVEKDKFLKVLGKVAA